MHVNVPFKQNDFFRSPAASVDVIPSNIYIWLFFLRSLYRPLHLVVDDVHGLAFFEQDGSDGLGWFVQIVCLFVCWFVCWF